MEDMTIFQIDQAIIDLFDPETGDLLPDALERLQALQGLRETKVENIAMYILNLTALADGLKERAKEMQARQKSAERKIASLKGLLDYALEGRKYESPNCKVTFRKTTSCTVDNPDLVLQWARENGHPECIRVPEVPAEEVAKAELLKLLKAGEAVNGAYITEGRSVTVK